MLRLLRISGILFFAIMIGVTANRLQELYKAGILFDRYNSQRRADITLFTLSLCGLATLGFFEYARSRRSPAPQGFGLAPVKAEPETKVKQNISTSIYAAPETIDSWQGRRVRTAPSRHHRSVERSNLWERLLRIYCGVLPVLYLYTLIDYLLLWLPNGAGNLILTILFPTLLFGAVMTSSGILRKKTWGRHFGYALATFHLLIFPVGTFAGLIMLVALLGSDEPNHSARDRHLRREVRRAMKRRGLQSAA